MFERKQFILVDLVPSATKQGKHDKRPIDSNGRLINAMEPSNWRSYEEVSAEAKSKGKALAFVLTDNDPYFCVDIDGCLMPDGKSWSPLSLDIIKQFPGSFVEVSVSGTGLHVWGSYDKIPTHGMKNTKLNIELYHQLRFVVLNPDSGQGDWRLKFDAVLPEFVNKYFPPSKSQENGTPDWTTEPRSGWAGHTDDTALIESACSQTSYASVFGGGVSFKDLWEKNSEAMANKWPSGTHEDGYDASSADAALAQRLAYLTGCDCERMLTLMKQSALVRDKWEERPAYLKQTILNAISRQEKVDTSQAKDDSGTGISRKIAGGWVQTDELSNVFEGCVYIINQHKVALPSGAMVKPEQFKVLYGGYKFMLDDNKTTRNAWEAFTECPSWRPQTADEVCFMPEEKPKTMVIRHGQTYYNIWQPPIIPREKGDASKFENILALMFPEKHDRDILRYYMAAALQHAGTKFSWAPIIHGPKGSCKTFLNTVMLESLGSLYSYTPKQEVLGEKNNGWIERRLFAGVEELYVKDAITENAIKTLVTEESLAVEEKYVAQKFGQNRVNFMFTTNYYDAIRISRSERRFAPVSIGRTKEQVHIRGLTNDVAADLWDWAKGVGVYSNQPKGWHIIADYLMSLNIPDEYNPARKCRVAPHSSTWELFVTKSQGTVEAEVLEQIEQGTPGFAEDWISSIQLDRFLKASRWASRVPINRRREFLEELGYEPHPALVDGRVTRVVMPDAGKPRLFIRKGSLKENLDTPSKVCQQYEKDQQAANVEVAGASFRSR